MLGAKPSRRSRGTSLAPHVTLTGGTGRFIGTTGMGADSGSIHRAARTAIAAYDVTLSTRVAAVSIKSAVGRDDWARV